MFKRRRTPFSSMTVAMLSAIAITQSRPKLSPRGKRTMRNGLNLGGGAHGLVGGKTALGVDQVGCEDGVDQSRFTQASLSYKQRENRHVNSKSQSQRRMHTYQHT